ncbi:hypothetical protein [Agromyces atrinae]|uniref:Right-handed parallel beta-helix repeat-containing protein n=1 Tax=Agromyces atrinae TaxID=592376 RepID=A0A4Q2M759_9MICO|nr:hypothetical protein [Agromyces atrinae]NYD68277.1 hypothetical protein [Agromyces atrinae]RXZ85662.1 hypothetical protein ESP50_14335 [Agromyces atrinae]
MPQRRSALVTATSVAVAMLAAFITTPAAHAAESGATFYVAPDGDDSAAGTSSSSAFGTLARAQEAVRGANTDADVTVILGDGTYRLDSPLVFGVADGGQGDHTVTWRAAPDAQPEISGGRTVENWTNPGTGIWQAELDSDFDFRQLYVDGKQATRSNAVVDANKFTWSRTGFSIDPAYLSSSLGSTWSKLSALSSADQRRVELRSRGSFTDRVSPVLSFGNNSASMQQPGWDNNTWGWDTIDKPLPDNSHRTLRIQNALALVDTAGEWFYDIHAETLHYKPANGVDPNTLDIVAPTQHTLLSVSGDGPDSPVTNLAFEGLSFQHASDIRPNSNEGLANQQNGTYISGRIYALVDPQTRDLPTSDQRTFDGATQAPSVRVIRMNDDMSYAYADTGEPVAAADVSRLINVRDYPNLPLNSSQLAAWNSANPNARKTNCAVPTYPSDCIAFEAYRSFFDQTPAAVQVSAAHHISFTGNTFAHIGSNAVGIGNDAAANLSGIGLATQDITMTDNTFTDIAGTAVTAGGVNAEAHHPSIEGNRNARLTLSDNRISNIGLDYFDRSAILVTYFDGAEIVHNELSNGAYDAIDTGWGWGIPDAGGNPAYQGRGAYLFSTRYGNDLPTANRNIRIANNVMWNFKQQGSDGGILYNLGSTPGSSWDSNYVMGSQGYKLYFDEGTRYMTAKNNVLSAGGTWTFANAFTDGSPTPANGQPNTTMDNTVDGTWVLGRGFNQGPWCYDSGACDPNGDGRWKNRITTSSQIGITEYPLDAQRVIAAAGIRPEHRRSGDWVGQPRGLDLGISRDTSGAQIITATMVNLGTVPLASLAITATASNGMTLSPLTTAPTTLAPGATGTATWRVTGGAAITDGTVTASSASRIGTAALETVKRTLPVVLGGPVDSALRVAGFDTYLAPQAVQSGSTLALQSSGRDIGNAGDEFTTVYSPDGLGVNGSVTTKLDAVEGSYYRTGLSVRNDLSRFADAAVTEKSLGYATLVAEPGWIAFRTDENGDGVIDKQVDQAGVPNRPLWLRIARSGNILTASYSVNGTAFTALGGTVELTGADAGALDAGVVHSSASRTSVGATAELTASTATFSDMTFVDDARTPVISSGRQPAGAVGQPYTFAITATNDPTFSVIDGALPDGLAIDAAGTISGTPTRPGTFSATVEARGAAGTATAPVRITIRESAPTAPEISITGTEPTAPGLTTGRAEIQVKNTTPDAATYAVAVRDAADTVVHSSDITAESEAIALTTAERLPAGDYTVSVTGDDGSPSAIEQFTITDGAFAGVAAPWKSTSQGGAVAETMGVEGDQLAILRQRSSDVSGENAVKSDSYSSLYQSDVLGANDSIQVTVTGQQRVGDFTKSGLIIRDDLAVSTGGSTGASNGSGSSSGEAILVLTPTRGIRFTVENQNANWYPIEVAATTPWNVTQTLDAPVTLKLTRENGTKLIASYSLDGGATFQTLATRTGFFGAKPGAALDAGVTHSANGGVTGGASTATFRDFLSADQVADPLVQATASKPDVDNAATGAAEIVVTNPTDRRMTVDIATTNLTTGATVFQSGAAVPAGDGTTVTAPRLAAGEHLVTVRDRATGRTSSASVSIEAAAGLRIEPTVASRCVARKVTLTVSLTNPSEEPLAVSVETAYGTKAIAALQPGATGTLALSTRSASMPAGTVSVTASAPSGDSATVPVDYPSLSCR